jgi:hypothetical protein
MTFYDCLSHFHTVEGLKTMKSRVHIGPNGERNSYFALAIRFQKISFIDRLVWAFWYLIRPRDEDAIRMVNVTLTDAAPPIDTYEHAEVSDV